MSSESTSRRERRHHRHYEDGDISYDNDESKTISKASNAPVTGKSLVDLKPKPIEKGTDKNKVISKVLTNLSEMISPDANLIADTLYEQLKNTNMPIEKHKIESAVRNSKHFRNSDKVNVSDLSVPTDREKLKLVVEDVYTQIENEHIRNKNNKVEDIKETKKEKTKTDTKPKEKKKESKKEDSDIKELLDEDEEIDLSDDSSEDDDLGMKF